MNKFAFITHPMDTEDIHRNFPLSKKMPEIMIEKVSKRLLAKNKSHIEHIKTRRGETQGPYIEIPLTLKQIQALPEEKIVQKVLRAGKLAKKQGVDIIGLGGGFSSIKNIGNVLEEHLSIPVTTGQTYTMLSILEGVKRIVELQEKNFKECEVTIIIDETFPVVLGAINYLAREAKYLTLVSNDKESKDKKTLESLCQEIFQETGTAVHISNDMEASMKRVDIVITGRIEGLIKEKSINNKSIICDFSEYNNKVLDIKGIQKELTIVDDGIIKLPGEVDFGIDLGLEANSCCPSLAELILLALENHLESFSQTPEVELVKIDTMKDMAMKNNFDLIGVNNIYKDKIIF